MSVFFVMSQRVASSSNILMNCILRSAETFNGPQKESYSYNSRVCECTHRLLRTSVLQKVTNRRFLQSRWQLLHLYLPTSCDRNFSFSRRWQGSSADNCMTCFASLTVVVIIFSFFICGPRLDLHCQDCSATQEPCSL